MRPWFSGQFFRSPIIPVVVWLLLLLLYCLFNALVPRFVDWIR